MTTAEHEYENDPDFPIFSFCKRCGHGWKWDEEEPPCPGYRITFGFIG